MWLDYKVMRDDYSKYRSKLISHEADNERYNFGD